MTYFTTVVGEKGKVATFADLYGLDNKMATALFGDAVAFLPRRRKILGHKRRRRMGLRS